jgi:hypothetical protein
MALIRDELCQRCEQTKPVDAHVFRGVCHECLKAEADQKRRMFLASLTGLTIEERVKRIEELLYDLPLDLSNRFEPKHIVYR